MLTPAACPCRGDRGALDALMFTVALPSSRVLSAVVVVGRDDAMSTKGLRCLPYAQKRDIRAGLQQVCFVPKHEIAAR